MSDEALAYLTSLPLPGNVRQLENRANWLTVMVPAQTVEIKDLPPELGPRRRPRPGEGVTPAAAAVSSDALPADTNGAMGGMLPGAPIASGAVAAPVSSYLVWEQHLRTEVARLLRENPADVMDELARRFEATVIREALDFTRSRKVEAAERLGIGHNTITRKLQELHLEP